MDGRKRDCSILVGWRPVNVKPAKKRKEQKKHRLCRCPERPEIGREKIPEVFSKLEQKARTSKKEWKWQRGIVEHPLSESQWNRGHFSMRKWESEKHKSWGMPAEGFKGHVATDGSLLGNSGKSWTTMKKWDLYMGCMAQRRQNSRFSALSRGRS